jgi:hypothetical protein
MANGSCLQREAEEPISLPSFAPSGTWQTDPGDELAILQHGEFATAEQEDGDADKEEEEIGCLRAKETRRPISQTISRGQEEGRRDEGKGVSRTTNSQ